MSAVPAFFSALFVFFGTLGLLEPGYSQLAIAVCFASAEFLALVTIIMAIKR